MEKLRHTPRYRHLAAATAPLGIVLALSGCGAGVRTLTESSSQSVTSLAVTAAPKLGYAWGETDKTLRPIIGIPGAAQFGESVIPANTYEGGAANPNGTYAIMFGTGQTFYRVSLPDGAATVLGGKVAAGSRVVYSPGGSYALVYSPGGTDGRVLTNTANSPQTRSITFAGPVVEAVVSEGGSVAATLRSSDNVPVQVLSASGAAVSLPSLKSSGGLSFVASTDDLLLADANTNVLVRIRSASSMPSSMIIPTAGLLQSPVAVATSRSGHWAVIASSGSAVRIDLTGALAPQSTPCNCKPSTVAQLASDGAFRLTALQNGPVWIGDASRSAFPVLFIPSSKGGL